MNIKFILQVHTTQRSLTFKTTQAFKTFNTTQCSLSCTLYKAKFAEAKAADPVEMSSFNDDLTLLAVLLLNMDRLNQNISHIYGHKRSDNVSEKNCENFIKISLFFLQCQCTNPNYVTFFTLGPKGPIII